MTRTIFKSSHSVDLSVLSFANVDLNFKRKTGAAVVVAVVRSR